MSEQRMQTPSTSSRPARGRGRSVKSAERAATAEPRTRAPTEPLAVVGLSALDRDAMIATAAYFRAQRRNFEAGHELEDWLAAESEVDAALLAAGNGST